jgi:excisionase family DNA binding protein
MAQSEPKRDVMHTANELELLTVEQVQEELQVGRTLAYRLVKSGELPSYRIGKLRRIRRQDVEDWLERTRSTTGAK